MTMMALAMAMAMMLVTIAGITGSAHQKGKGINFSPFYRMLVRCYLVPLQGVMIYYFF